MVNKSIFLAVIYLFFCVISPSCKKPDLKPVNIDCMALTEALKAGDFQSLAKQVNVFFSTRKRMPTEFDPEGYKEHFYELSKQIDNCDVLTVSYAEYQYYQTDPPVGQLMVILLLPNKKIISRIYTSYNKEINRYRLKLLLSI